MIHGEYCATLWRQLTVRLSRNTIKTGSISTTGMERNGKTASFEDSSSDTEKRRKVLGVEVAPLKIPWERRMETVAVACWIGAFLFAGPCSVALLTYMIIYTRFWWLALAYLAWFIYDIDTPNRGGRRSDWVRNWKLWKRYTHFFPIKLVKTAEMDPALNYLWCYHPHGVLCAGAFGSFATEGMDFTKVFPGMTPHLLTMEGHFWFPLYRDYVLSGGVCSASRSSLNYLLNMPDGGHAAILVPGGAPESLDSHPSPECRVHLKKRKGFVKVALQNGVPLVPVFCFGETDIYDQVPNPEGSLLRKVQDTLQQLMGMAPVLFLGRGFFQYTFGLLPYRRPVTVVVGAPIACKKVANPTQKEIDTLHAKYVEALTSLFDDHKDSCFTTNKTIKIV